MGVTKCPLERQCWQAGYSDTLLDCQLCLPSELLEPFGISEENESNSANNLCPDSYRVAIFSTRVLYTPSLRRKQSLWNSAMQYLRHLNIPVRSLATLDMQNMCDNTQTHAICMQEAYLLLLPLIATNWKAMPSGQIHTVRHISKGQGYLPQAASSLLP